MQLDVACPTVQTLILPNTDIQFGYKATSGKSVDGAQVPYVKDTAYSNLIVNSNLVFQNPKLVASQLNETDLIQAGVGAYNNKSFVLNARMTSTMSNLSPVIDLSRVGLIVVANRIANYSHTNNNVDTYDLRSTSLTVAGLEPHLPQTVRLQPPQIHSFILL